jgi:phosphoadenosine phosphosulfate reductase
MPIFKGDGFAPDDWRNLAQGEGLPPEGKVILTLAQWQTAGIDAHIGNTPLGLLITPGQDIRPIAPDLARFALVAVAFPKFTDGRGYSLAHQLRSNFGFAGELRATGEVLFDQLQLLARCGFDSFEIRDVATIRLLEAGRRPGLRIFYQPGFGPEIPERARRLARRAIS